MTKKEEEMTLASGPVHKRSFADENLYPQKNNHSTQCKIVAQGGIIKKGFLMVKIFIFVLCYKM